LKMRTSLVSMVYVLGLSLVVGVLVLTVQSTAPEITATVDIHPKTLNLNSSGTWITVYIELPDYNVSDIVVSTIWLERSVPAETNPKYGFVKNPEIKDRDGDGIPELMVKFDRQTVIGYIWAQLYHMEIPLTKECVEVELTIKGELTDGTPFSGSDKIRVIYHG